MACRHTLAALIDDGRAMVVDAAPGHIETVNRLVFDVLTASRVCQLGGIAEHILKAIDAEANSK